MNPWPEKGIFHEYPIHDLLQHARMDKAFARIDWIGLAHPGAVFGAGLALPGARGSAEPFAELIRISVDELPRLASEKAGAVTASEACPVALASPCSTVSESPSLDSSA